MIDSQNKLATFATCFMLVIGGFGIAGCGDDDNEGVVEDAGQGIDEAGEDIEGEANEEEGDDE